MRKIGSGLVMLALAVSPAFASGIDYLCDTTDSNAIPTNVCNILQTTISGEYASIFTDANAYIYVEYGAPAGDVGENFQNYKTVSYSAYYNALKANESGPNDAAAVLSLGGGTSNPVISGQGVALTSALDAALGFSGQAYGVTASGATCNTIGSNGCYNDVIELSSTLSFYYDGITAGSQTSSEYDFFTTVEHETDEALGTSSCLANGTGLESGGCDNGPNPDNPGEACYPHCPSYNSQGVSAADLFRYASPGVRSYSSYDGTSNGSMAYFSINSGYTDIVPYNNTTSGGADYGDFSTYCKYVQDAYGCLGGGAGLNIENDGGVEIALLDAVGYNLTAEGMSLSGANAPEPGTIGMFGLGLGMVALMTLFKGHRRRSGARSQGHGEPG